MGHDHCSPKTGSRCHRSRRLGLGIATKSNRQRTWKAGGIIVFVSFWPLFWTYFRGICGNIGLGSYSAGVADRRSGNGERKCADTVGTVQVPRCKYKSPSVLLPHFWLSKCKLTIVLLSLWGLMHKIYPTSRY